MKAVIVFFLISFFCFEVSSCTSSVTEDSDNRRATAGAEDGEPSPTLPPGSRPFMRPTTGSTDSTSSASTPVAGKSPLADTVLPAKDHTSLYIQGSYCSLDKEENILFGDLNSGVAGSDDNTGIGYLMLSEQDIAFRFSPPPPDTQASHLILVRYLGESWQYDDDKSQWKDFTPAKSDRLLAGVDFDSDETFMFDGRLAEIKGMKAGYSTTDLVMTPNHYGDANDPGEFGLSGSSVTIAKCLPEDELRLVNYGGGLPKVGETNAFRGYHPHQMLSLGSFSLIYSALKGPEHADFQGGAGRGVRLSTEITAIFHPVGSAKSGLSLIGGATEAGGIELTLGDGTKLAFDENGNALDFRFEKWKAGKSGEWIFIDVPGKSIYLKNFSGQFKLDNVLFDDASSIEYVRDSEGRVTQILNHVPSKNLAKATKTVFTWAGDKLAEVTDEDGHVWKLKYSPTAGELERLIEPTGNEWKWTYQDGRAIQKTTPGGLNYFYAYDYALGKIEKITHPGNYVEAIKRSNHINSDNQLLANSSSRPTIAAASGQNYDILGRLQKLEENGNTTLTIVSRDYNGMPTEVKNLYGNTYKYQYDGQRMTRMVYVKEGYVDDYVYNAKGYLIRLEEKRQEAPARKFIHTYEMNSSFPYLVNKYVEDSNGPSPNTTEYTYDVRARLKKVTYNGAVRGQWEYNDDNQVTKQFNLISGGILPQFYTDYSYDLTNANLTKIEERKGNRTIIWNVKAWTPSGSPTELSGGPDDRSSIKVDADSLGRITGLSASGGRLGDESFKITSMTSDGIVEAATSTIGDKVNTFSKSFDSKNPSLDTGATWNGIKATGQVHYTNPTVEDLPRL